MGTGAAARRLLRQERALAGAAVETSQQAITATMTRTPDDGR
jgi:hypothetical protein